MELKDSQEHLKKASTPEGSEAGKIFGATSKESAPSSDLQTVRASLFENVVERHSVLMVEEGKSVNKANDSLSSPSFKRGSGEEEGTLVTATYKEPVSPSSPLRVLHAFDTVQAVEESRAVSEHIPSAQREDKAMTLRTRRSEGSKPVAERTGEPAPAVMPDQQPRYLRVGALPKWAATGLEQEVEKGMLKDSQRDGQVALDQDRQREAEQEEVAAAPKRLKMLQAEDQPKPRATYFALTGQIQEPLSPSDGGPNMSQPFDDFSVRSTSGSSQGKVLPVRRNPSLEEAFGKTTQDQVEELLMRSHMSHREIRSASEGQTLEEMMEVENKRELKKETERHMAKLKDLERERQRHIEMEKEAHLEFARMKEREMQREFERQRQKAFEKEKQEFEEKQRALERQKQLELEQKQKLQEVERARLRELEKERQRQLEKEKRRELERQKKIEREKQREQERERQREQDRQRQREEERQRELDKERQLLEIQKEKQKMEELERIKDLERLQLLEFQKQKQKEKEWQQIQEVEKQRLREKKEREEAEKIKQMALEQEMLRLRELDKERERQKEMERERLKEIEREKQRELERQRQRDLERERQRQLDMERQELENQRLRHKEQEKERLRKEELERFKEMERRKLLELEKQKQAERERQQILELEKRRLREKMEREEAEKMRQIAKQQEAERQRLKEKQKREEQAKLESSPLRPKVLDLDAVLRNDPFSKATPQRSDPATRWKEPSPRAEEPYRPAILDIDSFTSQAQPSPSKDLFPVSGIQGVDAGFGAKLQPDVDVSWRVPTQTPVGITNPVWTASPQDPWELRPVEMPVDKPVAEPRKHANRLGPEQLLLRQEERLLTPQRPWSAVLDEPPNLAPLSWTEAKSGGSPGGVSAEQIWVPREPQPQDRRGHRRSQGVQVSQRFP